MDENFEKLVNTLMSNRLAASTSEAHRMAEEMLGTSKKVHDGFQNNKFYAVNNFNREKENGASQPPSANLPGAIPQSEAPQAPSSSQTIDSQMQSPQPQTPVMSPSEQKIQEFRDSAINPKPVDVQVDFQTPKTDTITTSAQEPETQQTPDHNSPLPDMAPAPVNAEPDFPTAPEEPSQEYQNPKPTQPEVNSQPSTEMTPEEYSASQMNNSPQTTTSDFLSLKEPEEVPTPSTDFANQEEPAPEPQHTEFSEPTPTYSENTQTSEQPYPQTSSSNIDSSWPEQKQQASPEQQPLVQNMPSPPPPEPAPEAEKPKRQGTWSEADKKLAEDVDLTKIFNVNKG